ncbi:hypothetical protein ABIE44_003853 [Marmoricola sp. OAE513]|uniref:DUF2510 domain-containing protein n=1 Tax=Marmoricola sp. OAE513 TaxID=2817894 RepID=UPI001AEB23A5
MTIEVSEAAVSEVTAALGRNLSRFDAPAWVQAASATVAQHGDLAAAQLAPGETVDWLTPGILHRYGKTWPNAVMLLTPHRMIITASRGGFRTKHDFSSLYRGPESLIGVHQQLLPGTSTNLWMLEITSDSGPFFFAFPEFRGDHALAEETRRLISREEVAAPSERVVAPRIPTQRVAPDWYDDPLREAPLRYWDGEAWTPHTAG